MRYTIRSLSETKVSFQSESIFGKGTILYYVHKYSYSLRSSQKKLHTISFIV